MKRLVGVFAFIAIAVLLASAVQAQGPPRSQTKELQFNAPGWVKTAMQNQDMSIIKGMKWTATGWQGDGTPIASQTGVYHFFGKRTYTRDVYEVSFEKPQTYLATVVFEDFGRERTATVREPAYTPVLVHSVTPPTRPTHTWEYDQ